MNILAIFNRGSTNLRDDMLLRHSVTQVPLADIEQSESAQFFLNRQVIIAELNSHYTLDAYNQRLFTKLQQVQSHNPQLITVLLHSKNPAQQVAQSIAQQKWIFCAIKHVGGKPIWTANMLRQVSAELAQKNATGQTLLPPAPHGDYWGVLHRGTGRGSRLTAPNGVIVPLTDLPARMLSLIVSHRSTSSNFLFDALYPVGEKPKQDIIKVVISNLNKTLRTALKDAAPRISTEYGVGFCWDGGRVLVKNAVDVVTPRVEPTRPLALPSRLHHNAMRNALKLHQQ